MIKDKQSYRILVIEDNPGDFTIVEEFLREYIVDPDILHVVDFKQASAILSSDDTLLDVILLDLTLPDKNGQNLITEMLRKASLCPVIILTGYADIDFSINSISQGILDYLIKDDLNAITLYKSIIYAIERKKIISHLAESEKRYSDLFHLSPEPMWVYELETLHFLDVNIAAINHYGYSREEFLSMIISEIGPEEDIHKTEEVVLNLRQHDPLFFQGIFRHKKKDGELIHVDIHSNIILFKGKKAKLILANDITERIKYIEAIEKQNEKLREIAWIQSHIVRAPLARMLGIVNHIKELKIASPECAELLNHFIDSGTELDTIIKDIAKKTELVNIKIN